MRVSSLGLVVASLAVTALPACATYTDDLARGERAFEASEDERALAIFRMLERDQTRLDPAERAHYAYLRGMTDYRIGYKAESRHWLTLASALEAQTPNSLPAEWTKRLGDALKELNEEVYTAGIESLSNTAVAKAKDDSASESSGDPDDPRKAAQPPTAPDKP
jgi:hypothetical protein